MKYKLVIFDWDGTLMNSINRIVSSMHASAAEMGLPRVADSAVKDIIGLSLNEAIARLYPQLDAAQVEQMKEHYRVQYQHKNTTPAPLFEHAEAMLGQLRGAGIQLAVATGKARRGLDRVLAETGLEALFQFSRGADEANSKPDPLMLSQLLEEANVAVSEALMVGDSVHDMEMARRIGMDRVAVTFGVHDGARLAPYGPLAIVDCLSQLPGVCTMEAAQPA